MLTVFTRYFVTETQINAPHVRDAPRPKSRKTRWLPDHHWWREHPRARDMNNL